MKKKMICAVVVGLMISIMCGCDNHHYQTVEISKMMSDLRENVALASQHYTGMYVSLSGRLDRVDEKGKYFTIDVGDPVKSIYCSIKDNQQWNTVGRKSMGGTVYVRGKIRTVGALMGYAIDVDTVE